MQNHDQPARTGHSSFFMLNVWEEALGGGHTEWRGEILDVDNNALCSFDDWPEMVDLIATALQKLRLSDTDVHSLQQKGQTPTR